MLTSEARHHVPDFDAALGGELSHGELHEVEGPSDEEEDNQVGDQEGSPAVLVSSERKTPHV